MDTVEDQTGIILDALQRPRQRTEYMRPRSLGGKFDEQWPLWYAGHMTRTLAESGYRIVRTGDDDDK